MNVNIPPHPTPQSYSGLRSSRSLDKPIYTHTYRDRLSEHWWMVRATAWEQNTKELLWLYPQIHKTTTNNYILILLHNLTCNDYNSHVLKSSFCFWTRLGSDSQLIFRMASHYWHNIYIYIVKHMGNSPWANSISQKDTLFTAGITAAAVVKP